MNELDCERKFKRILERLKWAGHDITYDIFYGTLTLYLNKQWIYKCREWERAYTYINGVEQGMSSVK